MGAEALHNGGIPGLAAVCCATALVSRVGGVVLISCACDSTKLASHGPKGG